MTRRPAHSPTHRSVRPSHIRRRSTRLFRRGGGSHRVGQRRAGPFGIGRLGPVGIARLGPVTLCAVGIVLGLATMAGAYVTLISSGTGTAHASAIGPPASFTAASSLPDQATLSWDAPSNPSPTGYTLVQSPGTLAGTCTELTGSSVSCTATGLTPGTQYTWQLTATYDSWAGTTVTATVTTGSPSIALAPVAGVGGTLVTMTGSGFAPSSHLTFTFVSSGNTSAPLTATNCIPTTTASGVLPPGPCEITIPTGSSLGAGTVAVTDAAGSTATAAFTVSPGAGSGTVTASAGLGTLTVAPASVVGASTGSTLAFTYTATGGALASGQVDLGVAPWVAAGGTAPQTKDPSGAGYTVASTGSVAYTVAKDLIEVTGVTLPANGTLTLTYGSGGGVSGVSAPAPNGTPVPYPFAASESSAASAAPATLATSPQVTVVPAGGGASGGASSPTGVAGSATTG